MGDDELLNQNEIEKLLAQGAGGGGAKPEEKSADSGGGQEALDQAEIEALLGGAKSGNAEAAAANDDAASAPEQPASETAQQPAAAAAQPSGPDIEDADKLLGQDDIEKLLNQAGRGAAAKKKEEQSAPSAGPQPEEADIPEQDLDLLLKQAEAALASINEDQPGEVPPGVVAFQLHEFSGAPPSTEAATLDLVKEVELDVKIELGRTHMYLEDVLRLRKGSVVPLDKLAGDPVDIYVNGRLVARGEVLVLNDNFCIRVAELVAGQNPAVA
ncbi:MAG: flagellar motor switch protein FliN [Planctomycetota bacterium]|nr:MAG: flagellar motor switch protein FliN [Planctomycetota bacterium]